MNAMIYDIIFIKKESDILRITLVDCVDIIRQYIKHIDIDIDSNNDGNISINNIYIFRLEIIEGYNKHNDLLNPTFDIQLNNDRLNYAKNINGKYVYFFNNQYEIINNNCGNK